VKILVTGGSGFIGSALVRRWVREGHAVRVLDNGMRGQMRRLEAVDAAIEYCEADVRDADAVDRATRGMDTVAHLAYINGTEFFYTKPDLVLEIALKGLVHTIDAAIRHGVGRYWLMSSGEVYQTPEQVPTDETVSLKVPDPLNPRYSYGGGKIISELYAINFGRRHFDQVSIVRPHNVYGPDMGWEHVVPQFALRAMEQVEAHPEGRLPFPIQGDGTQTRAFCYIDDFVEGCSLAFTKGEHLGIHHVGTMEEVPIRQVAEEVVRCFGRDPEIQPSEEPAGQTQRRCPDIRKARALGYEPRVSLIDGIARTVEWYRRNRHLKFTLDDATRQR
jgi:nucleoside-diphosphate-sugar epimerase